MLLGFQIGLLPVCLTMRKCYQQLHYRMYYCFLCVLPLNQKKPEYTEKDATTYNALKWFILQMERQMLFQFRGLWAVDTTDVTAQGRHLSGLERRWAGAFFLFILVLQARLLPWNSVCRADSCYGSGAAAAAAAATGQMIVTDVSVTVSISWAAGRIGRRPAKCLAGFQVLQVIRGSITATCVPTGMAQGVKCDRGIIIIAVSWILWVHSPRLHREHASCPAGSTWWSVYRWLLDDDGGPKPPAVVASPLMVLYRMAQSCGAVTGIGEHWATETQNRTSTINTGILLLYREQMTILFC